MMMMMMMNVSDGRREMLMVFTQMYSGRLSVWLTHPNIGR
jgi:hypothetical protein